MSLSRALRLASLLSLAFMLASNQRLRSQVEWQRQSSGPVLAPDAGGGGWTEVGDPSVIREAGQFTLWYDAEGPLARGIVRATSADGIEWLPDEQLALSSLPGTWESSIYTPRVIVDDPGYRMWYSGTSGTGGAIGHATSADGKSWTRDAANPVLSPSQAWEGSWIDAPSVLFDGETYRMWYTGGGDQLAVLKIGMATSTDGATWTKHAQNPVLREGSTGVRRGAALPCVIRDPATETFEMWYTIFDDSTSALGSIGYAASMDGIAWARYPGNPVLETGDWDAETGAPTVLFDGKEYLMWYTGGPAGSYSIGHARAPWTLPKASFTALSVGPEVLTGTIVRFEPSRSVSPNGEIVAYHWDFGDGGTSDILDAHHSFGSPGYHIVTLTVTDSAGKVGSVARAVDVRLFPGELGPWSNVSVGDDGIALGARHEGDASGGCLVSHTRGGTVGGPADALQLIEREIEGDFVLTARVDTLEPSSSIAKVGLMVREGPDAGARHASILLQGVPGGSLKVVSRPVVGGVTRTTRGPPAQPLPGLWLRLERRGSAVTAFTSGQGELWEPVGEPVIFDPPLGSAVAVGVAAAAGSSPESGALDLLAVLCDLQVSQGIGPFIRGDCNGDGAVTGQVADAIFLLAHRFLGGAAPACAASCDVNSDGTTDISDAAYVLSFNFLGGPPPGAPFPACARSDAAGDVELGCAEHTSCR